MNSMRIILASLFLLFVTRAWSSDKLDVFEQVVAIEISKTLGQCSTIDIRFEVLTNRDIELVQGSTGIGGERFLTDALLITHGDEHWRNKQVVIRSRNSKSFGQSGLILSKVDSPLVSTIDINEYFDLGPGGYYVKYFQLVDILFGEKYNITEVAESQRYYMLMESDGCIHVFQ